VAPWKLSDGTEVLLRPIKPEDEQLIAEMLATMTEGSLRDRFFGGIPEFTHERLVRFTNIDYERELAIVAELTKGRSRRILGVGRLIVHPEREMGEFSVIVHDEFQRRGLGRKLADLMIGIAEDKGITTIEGLVSEDNAPLLSLAKQLGFFACASQDGIVRLRLDLA
jgi:acetyltransferase